MSKIIVKISRTVTILNNFSNCCQFHFGVLLKNGKIGPRTLSVLFGKKEPKYRYVPMVKLNENRSVNFLAFVSTRAGSGSQPNGEPRS